MDEVTTLRGGIILNYGWTHPITEPLRVENFPQLGGEEDVAEWERAGTTGATQHASAGSEMQVPWEHQREATGSSSQTAREGTQAAPGMRTGQ